MPGELVGRVAKGGLGMWTRVKFPNGDQVMISMAHTDIRIVKMKWGGAFPERTLVSLSTSILGEFRDANPGASAIAVNTAVLDWLTKLLLMCESADDAQGRFTVMATQYL